MNVGLIIAYLGFHFLGDFVFQPDKMAKGKSKDTWLLFIHVLIHYAVLSGGGLLLTLLFDFTVRDLLAVAFINALLHFWIDFVTSRVASKFYRQQRVHAFFVTIGFDQFLHTAILVWSLTLLGRMP